MPLGALNRKRYCRHRIKEFSAWPYRWEQLGWPMHVRTLVCSLGLPKSPNILALLQTVRTRRLGIVGRSSPRKPMLILVLTEFKGFSCRIWPPHATSAENGFLAGECQRKEVAEKVVYSEACKVVDYYLPYLRPPNTMESWLAVIVNTD